MDIRSKMGAMEMRKHGVFCGQSLPYVITSEGNSLRIEFNSDNSVQKSGFAAVFFTGEGWAVVRSLSLCLSLLLRSSLPVLFLHCISFLSSPLVFYSSAVFPLAIPFLFTPPSHHHTHTHTHPLPLFLDHVTSVFSLPVLVGSVFQVFLHDLSFLG